VTALVEPSPVESDRFGLRIGRCVVTGVDHIDRLAEACEGFDLVVLRYPAENVDVPVVLAGLDGFRCLPADHLCVWEWTGVEPPSRDVPAGWSIDTSPGIDDVSSVVRDSFAGYANHYRANPLLAPSAALDGYVEWAQHLAAEDDAAVVLRDAAGTAVGVALIDWRAGPPDVRLAGMRTSAQGRGLYPALIAHVIDLALRRGTDGVQISTQSHNTRVMRTWARLGFLPVRTVATVHLVRSELLPPAGG
jgi:GNAT superfamily N-acetyltransferase